LDKHGWATIELKHGLFFVIPLPLLNNLKREREGGVFKSLQNFIYKHTADSKNVEKVLRKKKGRGEFKGHQVSTDQTHIHFLSSKDQNPYWIQDTLQDKTRRHIPMHASIHPSSLPYPSPSILQQPVFFPSG
jgi:hypothetical protein